MEEGYTFSTDVHQPDPSFDYVVVTVTRKEDGAEALLTGRRSGIGRMESRLQQTLSHGILKNETVD